MVNKILDILTPGQVYAHLPWEKYVDPRQPSGSFYKTKDFTRKVLVHSGCTTDIVKSTEKGIGYSYSCQIDDQAVLFIWRQDIWVRGTLYYDGRMKLDHVRREFQGRLIPTPLYKLAYDGHPIYFNQGVARLSMDLIDPRLFSVRDWSHSEYVTRALDCGLIYTGGDNFE